ncbi:MAG: 4-hydroxythreonine-4-phosphate dehydrogenase PdxA [Acidobacteriota bacterium]
MSGRLVGCTMGDPTGIGPEIILKACAGGEKVGESLLLLADDEYLRGLAVELELGLDLHTVSSTAECQQLLAAGRTGPWVLPCGRVEDGLAHGRPRPADGRIAFECIRRGAELASGSDIAALVTAPVSKRVVATQEPAFLGHTEMLARQAGIRHPLMLFVGPQPAVALLTTHLPLASAIVHVRRDRVLTAISTLHTGWTRWLGDQPRIGVAGLNPHAGEGGLLGIEEERELLPAIAAAREKGLQVSGPYPADSIFRRTDIDAVLALYHDQGTIIAKRAPEVSVNLTLGLPYPRTSPDHGVAYDIAGQGRADPEPMRAALELAGKLASRR